MIKNDGSDHVLWSGVVADEKAMLVLGARLAADFPMHGLIFLQGDLGAGKSTLARGFIGGRGYSGHVKSPTYTLVEPYQTSSGTVYHMDLYRLSDPEELEFIGIRDLLTGEAICLIEWPERGQGVLPVADLVVRIKPLQQGREVVIEAMNQKSAKTIKALWLLRDNLE